MTAGRISALLLICVLLPGLVVTTTFATIRAKTLAIEVSNSPPNLSGQIAFSTFAIDATQETASGFLPGMWYSWVSYLGVNLIFVALHSNQYNSPVFFFVGQRYNTTAGTPIFVGDGMMLMEVFNDSDGNGVLDANYTSGVTELKYPLVMNSSSTFEVTPVQKTIEGNVTHFTWGLRYGGVDGLLNQPLPGFPGYGGGVLASKVTIDYVAINYDYSFVQNTTYLKTSYRMGSVKLSPPAFLNVTLTGLSLALLHSTVTISPSRYSIETGGNPFNSTLPGSRASPVNDAQVKLGNIIAFEFRFNDTYTLLQNPPMTYSAKVQTAPRDSVPPYVYLAQWFSPIWRVQDFLGSSVPGMSDLPIFPNLNYTYSSFLYRVSYSHWSGYPIEHDPTFVAHFVPIMTTLPIELIAFVAIAGVMSVGIAVRRLPSKRLRVAQTQDESIV